MKIFTRVFRLALLSLLLTGSIIAEVHSQEDIVELTLHARPVPSNPNSIRLLPREQELRNGNAAIELLRMPWEQTNFMELQGKRMSDWLEMKGDAPELLKYESAFTVFKNKMQRAAYTRDANWDYPIGEQPLASILLPDVQGMRGFVGRVMSLWIRIQISKGNLKNAEEGLLIQMACARHVCRTPFVVCQLVGAAIAQIGFAQFENLIQHPESENYYFALGMLPSTLGDFKAAIDLDASLIRSTMPSLQGKTPPPIGGDLWKTAFNELFDNFIAPLTSADNLDRKNLSRQAEIARDELPLLTDFSKDQIAKMSDEEIAVRWFSRNAEMISGKYVTAIQLPMHETIQSLTKLGKEIDELNGKVVFRYTGVIPEGATRSKFFDMYSAQAFISCHRIGRTAKLLQIVEAIRHYASQNDNQLPPSLADIELRIPNDPFSNKPADYEVKDGVATLSWPLIPNVEAKLNRGRRYKITMGKEK